MAEQPRGVRNYNPGNIEYGPFAQRHGATGTDGRFAIFQDMGAGYAAQEALLRSYMERGIATPQDIIARWAPAADGNNVSAYAGRVSERLGIRPDQPVTADMLPRLAEAMAEVENGRPVPRVNTTQIASASAAEPQEAPTPPLAPQTPPAASPGIPTGTQEPDDHQQRLAIIGAALTRQPTEPQRPEQSPWDMPMEQAQQQAPAPEAAGLMQLPQFKRPDTRRLVAALQARRTGRA
jgi:hypothetical protein